MRRGKKTPTHTTKHSHREKKAMDMPYARPAHLNIDIDTNIIFFFDFFFSVGSHFWCRLQLNELLRPIFLVRPCRNVSLLYLMLHQFPFPMPPCPLIFCSFMQSSWASIFTVADSNHEKSTIWFGIRRQSVHRTQTYSVNICIRILCGQNRKTLRHWYRWK